MSLPIGIAQNLSQKGICNFRNGRKVLVGLACIAQELSEKPRKSRLCDRNTKIIEVVCFPLF